MKSKTLPAWARLVCTAAAALVFLLVYEWAVYGVPLGRIYLPASAWSDEVYYAKQRLPPGGLRRSICTPSRG